MYLRAPSRCGGRRPGERCERPARVREPHGGRAGQRAGGWQRGRSVRATSRAERAGGGAGGAGGASGRRRWGTGARGLKGWTLPPVEPAVGAYRRIIRR